MANQTLELTIKATGGDRAAGEMKAVSGELEKTGKAASGAKLMFTEVASAVSLGGQAFSAVKGAVESVINPMVELAGQTRDLARDTGTSAKEASTMIQVADDLGISYDDLRMGAKKLNDEGIQPNVANLKILAAQYQAIPDPVKKAQFATDKFGRSSLEMRKILELAPEAIDDMANSAEAAGLVMSEQSVKAARDYEIAVDDLSDSMMGLKLAAAEHALPAIIDLANAMTEGFMRQRMLNQVTQDASGSYIEYTARIERFAAEHNIVLDLERGLIRVRDEHGRINQRVAGTIDIMTESELANAQALTVEEARLQALAGMTTGTVIPAFDQTGVASDNLYEAVIRTGDAFSLRFGVPVEGVSGKLAVLATQSIPETMTKIDEYLTKLTNASLTNYIFQTATDNVMKALDAGEISFPEAKRRLEDLQGAGDDGVITFAEYDRIMAGLGEAARNAAKKMWELGDAIHGLPPMPSIPDWNIPDVPSPVVIPGPANDPTPAPGGPGFGAPSGASTTPGRGSTTTTTAGGMTVVFNISGMSEGEIVSKVSIALAAQLRDARAAGAYWIGI